MAVTKRIQVFEHKTLKVDRDYEGVIFEARHFDALAKLNEYHDNKYFTLLHKAIKFSEYVGVVQVDDLVIEILPKVDNTPEETSLWQHVLIDMLKATNKLQVQNVGEAQITKQQIHLLDIYFQWFLSEVDALHRRGLTKQYYKEQKQLPVLKGKLVFSKHIQKNLVHKERFYTEHQIYDKDHLLHQIINQALDIIEGMSKGTYLYSQCKSVQLDFPETQSIQCTAKTFERIRYNRKNTPYRKAIEIARIIILNYAPNVSSGSERLLALLFDMNMLWEEYVFIKLRKALQDTDFKVYGQKSKRFWNNITIRPDIVITDEVETFVIDTKWKQTTDKKVSTQDLRQMFVYNEYWDSVKSMLLFPAKESAFDGFVPFEDKLHHCAIGKLDILEGRKLDPKIGEVIGGWFGINDVLEKERFI
jgi:5-methylcytosine-specific restriction enzyme subunit McrC